MSSEYAKKRVRARKTHWCAQDFAHDRRINPGDEYWIYTDFKSSDLGYATYAGHPVQMKMCLSCGERDAS